MDNAKVGVSTKGLRAMNIDLTSKNALIGSSTQGIGYGIAVELAKCGANVILMARNEGKL